MTYTYAKRQDEDSIANRETNIPLHFITAKKATLWHMQTCAQPSKQP